MLREGEKKNLHLSEVVETSVTGTVRAMEGCLPDCHKQQIVTRLARSDWTTSDLSALNLTTAQNC